MSADQNPRKTARDSLGRLRARLSGTDCKVVTPTTPSSPAAGVSHDLPSFAQARLIFLQTLWEPSPVFNVPLLLHCRGPVDAGCLREAFRLIAARHPSLRTCFPGTGADRRVVVAPSPKVLFAEQTLVSSSESRETVRAALLREAAARPFDLSVTPLWRVLLLRLDDHLHDLLITVHHSVFDGWSSAVLAQELGETYTALHDGTPLAVPTIANGASSHAAQQHAWIACGGANSQLSYWRTQLAELPIGISLPYDFPRPRQPSHRGGNLRLMVPSSQANVLRALAAEFRATQSMMLLTAFKLLLHLVSSDEDIVVGTVVAGRHHPSLRKTIGLFANMLALRTSLAGDPSFEALVARVRETTTAAYAHQDVPFDQVVAAVQPQRDLSRHPIFQVLFAFQTYGVHGMNFADLEVSQGEIETESAQFDIALFVYDMPQGLGLRLEYAAELFSEATIGLLAERFLFLLKQVTEQPKAFLSSFSLMPPAERRLTLVEWNATQAAVPNQSLTELITTSARKMSQSIALSHGTNRWSYDLLERRATQLARYLVDAGAGPGQLIAVCMERSPLLIASLLAILKTGAAYVPLDPTYPAERLAFQLHDTRAAIVLTQAAQAPTLSPINARLILLDQIWPVIETLPSSALSPVAGGDALAYVIYTSGSTGRPKGVALTHANVVNFVQWVHTAYSAEDFTCVAAVTSICFDLSIFEIFATLVAGGTVLLLDSALQLAEPGVGDSVTLINTVPSAMAALLEARPRLPALKVINLAGEALSRVLAERVHQQFETVRLYNLYGPSETTTYSTWTEIRPNSGPPAIGHPIANTLVYVLDRAGRPAPIGVVGELFIGGAGVASGYLDRPDLTQACFVEIESLAPGMRLYRTGDLVRWRPSGQLEYIGRRDHQAKLRGFRIELGEIESILMEQAQVSEALVSVRTDWAGEPSLVAYVVGRASLEVLEAVLRLRVPEFMVPAAFVRLDRMPLTANGKLDRAALPEPQRGCREQDALLTPTEHALAGLWREILGVEAIGPSDDFFRLGGNSLQIVRLVARVKAVFSVDIALQQTFQRPRLQEIAALIAEAEPARQDNEAEEGFIEGAL